MLWKLAYLLQPETAHQLAIGLLRRYPRFMSRLMTRPIDNHPALSQKLWGIDFANPIGLAAGFDKNAEIVPAMMQMGFGFIEVGTLTPRAQAGNDKPRLFRLSRDRAIINRLGFNNQGQQRAHRRLEMLYNQPKKSIIGVNIGKNKDTDDAIADYVLGWQQMADVADYITVNISSPNTAGLRELQQYKQLQNLLEALGNVRTKHQKKIPLFVKIAPDLGQEQIKDIVELSLTYQVNGLIISNTTIERFDSMKSYHMQQTGGLSGQPLFQKSTAVLAKFYRLTEGRIPLIGVGGVASAEQAYQKIRAGANLIQLYTALIYSGFKLVHEIHRQLPRLLAKDGYNHISQAIGRGA